MKGLIEVQKTLVGDFCWFCNETSLVQGRTVVGGIVSIKILLMRGADGDADIYR